MCANMLLFFAQTPLVLCVHWIRFARSRICKHAKKETQIMSCHSNLGEQTLWAGGILLKRLQKAAGYIYTPSLSDKVHFVAQRITKKHIRQLSQAPATSSSQRADPIQGCCRKGPFCKNIAFLHKCPLPNLSFLLRIWHIHV